MTTPPEPDPDDDLIAYLDGELDDDAAEAVESQLANDPAARTRADEYKRSFDLLDYLPKSEPSSTFATRTMTRLMPTAAASGPQPVVARRKAWPEVLAWCLLGLLAGGLAFAGHRGWRAATTPPPADLPLSDLAVIEHLPLYAGVDDVGFLRGLVAADLFDTDSADPPPARDALPTADREQLIAQFRGFTPARQQQLRTLHQALTDPATADRAALRHAAEGYAVWLARLPDADRKRVFDAPADDRLDVVRQVTERRWREGLPQKQQETLRHVSDPVERQELLQAYRAQEAARRQEWQFAQRQWKAGTSKDKDYKPWPFDDPDLSRQVDAYIASAFGVDPTAMPTPDREKKFEMRQECRLTREEVIELRERREAAVNGGYWFTYGALLLRLSELHPTLPRPGKGEPITQPRQLPKGYPPFKDGAVKAKTLVGRWPDFAEELARTAPKEGKLEPLGPCRPGDFSDPVNRFIADVLPGKLTKAEREKLEGMAGRWPEYPREVMRLAREKNQSVPEVTLPGEPDKWKQFYQFAPAKK
jgi:hypothetical protein